MILTFGEIVSHSSDRINAFHPWPTGFEVACLGTSGLVESIVKRCVVFFPTKRWLYERRCESEKMIRLSHECHGRC